MTLFMAITEFKYVPCRLAVLYFTTGDQAGTIPFAEICMN